MIAYKPRADCFPVYCEPRVPCPRHREGGVDMSTYSIDTLLDVLIRLTHQLHDAKLSDSQSLRIRRNWVRAEIKRRAS